jgi:GT2 family glycosyltransferase
MSDGYIHYWLGLAYQQQGEDLRALEEYLSAMKQNLVSSRIAYLAAGLAYQEQEWELAQHLWESLANLQLPEAEQMLMKVQQKAVKGKKSPREEHNQLFFLKELSPPPAIKNIKTEEDPPAVSVILPTKDRLQGAEALLNSLPAAADGRPYEVLVYAGGECLPELKRLLEPHPVAHLYQDEEIFSSQEPFSWAKLMNHGFTRAKGKWILYGSDDIVLYPHSISLALEEAKRGKYQGGITFLHRNTVQTFGNYYRNFGFDSFDGKTFINFGLISSQAYRATDGFDERFRFYWADADLCMQIWQAGMKIGVSPYSLVDHINVDDTIRQDNSRDRYRRDTRTYFQKWHGSALFTTERVLDRNRFVLRDEDAQRITAMLTDPKLPLSRSGDAPENGTAGQSNGPESQAVSLFSSLLEAADIMAAVEKRREELSPELVALIEENARRAELDGENELARGLTALSDHIAGYLRDQVRVQ